ncbi:glycosyltransferase [Luteimonas fraxinea]|uniref:glycosyltransferase n=1 Tax=Luteimonas fraxinea TaxID=2901869 RepID=UPI001E658DA1|nr:glycosyltransferase family 2 protein [Luteimonas fraxinea]MCD9124378.1 glycosyltransferase [Luteimonas fraxinea]
MDPDIDLQVFAMMSELLPDDMDGVVAITVTHHPDLDVLARQMRSLPCGCRRMVVDNASSDAVCMELERWAADGHDARFLQNGTNLGLPAAINKGVAAAFVTWPDLRFVLLLDQDSEPTQGAVARLVAAAKALAEAGHAVGTVGPALVEAKTGARHGFHQMTRFMWKRVDPQADSLPIPTANLNGSGSLIPVAVFERLGGLDASLFIDHVDTDWAFRVQAAGYGLWGVPASIFLHSMGERVLTFGSRRRRPWPIRTPARHFFLFRNAVILMRRPSVPRTWKIWAVGKLALTMLAHLILDRRRLQQISRMLAGILEGMTTRLHGAKPVDNAPQKDRA